MITKEELRGYAKKLSLNLGQAEKDYFQNIVLFILYQNFGRTLIFKGGTALKKCFGLARFSEDLDFTCLDKVDRENLEEGLKRFNLDFKIESKHYKNSFQIILKIKGPLYIGINNSLCKIILDFSLRESIIIEPEIKILGRFLEEIPSFDVYVMQEKEILAEKIRAIITRNSARDVYDLWFLLTNNIEVDLDLINKKLSIYNKIFDKKEFIKNLDIKKTIWESELKPLIISELPTFDTVKKEILKIFNYKF